VPLYFFGAGPSIGWPAMIPFLAHTGHGATDLGIPTWLAWYGSGIVVALTAALLRAVWRDARLDGALGPRPPFDGEPRRLINIFAQVIGIALLALVISAGALGPDRRFANLAPLIAWSLFPFGLTVLSLLVGNVWRTISPFETISRAWRQPDRRETHASLEDPPYYQGLMDLWPAAALLIFFWIRYGYHEAGSPRLLAVWLVAYTAAMIIGSLLGGPAWLRTNDALALWFGRIASLSPVGRDLNGELRFRRMLSGATRRGTARETAVLLVIIGSLAFSAIDSTEFWFSVVGDNLGWGLTLIRTLGLIWLVAMVSALYLGTEWLVSRITDRGEHTGQETMTGGLGDMTGRFIGLPTAILAGMTIAYGLTDALVDTQTVANYLSDPYNRQWDLIGTTDLRINANVLTPGASAWIELVSGGIGAIAAMIIGHDISIERFGPDAASRAGWVITAAVALAAIGISLSLLAG